MDIKGKHLEIFMAGLTDEERHKVIVIYDWLTETEELRDTIAKNLLMVQVFNGMGRDGVEMVIDSLKEVFGRLPDSMRLYKDADLLMRILEVIVRDFAETEFEENEKDCLNCPMGEICPKAEIENNRYPKECPTCPAREACPALKELKILSGKNHKVNIKCKYIDAGKIGRFDVSVNVTEISGEATIGLENTLREHGIGVPVRPGDLFSPN